MLPKERIDLNKIEEILNRDLLGEDSWLFFPNTTPTVEQRDEAIQEKNKAIDIIRKVRALFPNQKEVELTYLCSEEEEDFTGKVKELMSDRPKGVRGKKVTFFWVPRRYVNTVWMYIYDKGIIIKLLDPWGIEVYYKITSLD